MIHPLLCMEPHVNQYHRFHMGHNYNTKDCIMMNDTIKGMIKKGRLAKYTKDEKRSWEDSPKKKQAPEKIVEVMANGKGKDTSSGEEK